MREEERGAVGGGGCGGGTGGGSTISLSLAGHFGHFLIWNDFGELSARRYESVDRRHAQFRVVMNT
ncbi:unnamed protein product [Prunus armeniaca]